jgi:hypothetical protein
VSSGYGTANQPNTPNTNHKGVSSTTRTHNTANNDVVFGAFFQTGGKTTTSTAKTNNADVAKRTASTSTRHAGPAPTSTADPTSTTTSTIAHPVADPAVSLGAHKVTLIEVVIPVIILGILAAVAIPQFIDLSSDAKAAVVSVCEQEPSQQLCQLLHIGHLSNNPASISTANPERTSTDNTATQQ